MERDDRTLFEEIGANLSGDFGVSDFAEGDELAVNPPGNREPEIRTVERSDETITGTQLFLEGGSRLNQDDFNAESGVPRAAPIDNQFDSVGIREVGFERQNPNGRFAPEDTRPDPSVPADRAPDGRFVSQDRSEIESFGRGDRGLFDLF